MGVCKITPKPIVELQFGTIIHTELKAVNLRFFKLKLHLFDLLWICRTACCTTCRNVVDLLWICCTACCTTCHNVVDLLWICCWRHYDPLFLQNGGF